MTQAQIDRHTNRQQTQTVRYRQIQTDKQTANKQNKQWNYKMKVPNEVTGS